MTKINQTPTFNLGLVLQETGLNADTLRAWERRYGLPQPARSEGGHRLYSQHDLDTIKWLIGRQNAGMSISKAVKLWRAIESEGKDPLQEVLPGIGIAKSPPAVEIPLGAKLDDLRARWVEACFAFDEAAAEQVLTHAFALFPPETVCFEILFAGLSEIGESWYQNQASVQQEHFASKLVARRLNALISAAPPPIQNKTILVGCPPKEDHDLAALLITYLLRGRGWAVVYLGADIPLLNFKQAITQAKTDLLILTAQTLQSAATLKEVAVALGIEGIPLAYGGLIFNRNPILTRKIPGFFLGQDLRNVLTVIENLLTSSLSPISLTADHSIDQALIEYYLEIAPAIQDRVSERLGDAIPRAYLRIATQQLSDDITAALQLGDLAFLDGEMTWIKGLLVHAELPPERLQVYLLEFQRAANELMDNRGQEILDWLTKVTQTT